MTNRSPERTPAEVVAILTEHTDLATRAVDLVAAARVLMRVCRTTRTRAEQWLNYASIPVGSPLLSLESERGNVAHIVRQATGQFKTPRVPEVGHVATTLADNGFGPLTFTITSDGQFTSNDDLRDSNRVRRWLMLPAVLDTMQQQESAAVDARHARYVATVSQDIRESQALIRQTHGDALDYVRALLTAAGIPDVERRMGVHAIAHAAGSGSGNGRVFASVRPEFINHEIASLGKVLRDLGLPPMRADADVPQQHEPLFPD